MVLTKMLVSLDFERDMTAKVSDDTEAVQVYTRERGMRFFPATKVQNKVAWMCFLDAFVTAAAFTIRESAAVRAISTLFVRLRH